MDEAAALRRLAAREDLREDDTALPAAKYQLVIAIEAMTEGGWIGTELADALSDAARFRNLLVPQYADVDDDRVVQILQTRLDDLDQFVTTVAERLEQFG